MKIKKFFPEILFKELLPHYVFKKWGVGEGGHMGGGCPHHLSILFTCTIII